MSCCPSADQLRDYSLGKLPGAVFDTVEAHVETCTRCQTSLAELAPASDELLECLREPFPSATSSSNAEMQQTKEVVLAIGQEWSLNERAILPDSPLTTRQLRDYELVAELGRGGMGMVYKAVHRKLQRFVALKVLPSDRMSDAEAVRRFEREMQAVGRLDHPHIVRATDAGEADGVHFLVMECVEGFTLDNLVDCVGPLSAADACELIRQAALGLQHAHEHDLVHRDIKPSNLMLATSPAPAIVKVLDLGLALLQDNSPGGELTGTSQIMGTLDYMAPEQVHDTHAVDIRADIYSLGATLYKLLTGRAPLADVGNASPARKLLAVMNREPSSIRDLRPDLPPELASLVNRLLTKDPQLRPATPGDLAKALMPFASGSDLRQLAGRAEALKCGETSQASAARSSLKVSSHLVETDAAVPRRPYPAAALERANRNPSVPGKRKLRPKSLWLALLTTPLLLGSVIVITTSKGTVTIAQPEAVSDEVVIALRDGGDDVAIMDKSNHWTVGVRNGEYTVSIRGGSDQFEVKSGKVVVTRLGKSLVEVVSKRVPLVRSSPQLDVPGGKDPDRLAAEWLLSVGGTFRTNGNPVVSVGEVPTRPFVIDTIGLANIQNITDDSLKILEPCQKLTALTLDTVPIGDAGMVHFRNHRLGTLNLVKTRVTDRGLANFTQCQNLRVLNLRDSLVTDAGLANFRNAQQLEVLYLGGAPVTDAGLINFYNCRNLTRLDVSRTAVTDTGLAGFDGHSHLRDLILSGPTITDTGLAPFRNCTQLNYVSLDATRVSDEGLSFLKGCEQLNDLRLGNTSIGDKGLEHLQACRNLVRLDLSGTRVSDAGVNRLRDLPNLAHLGLSTTQITDAVLAVIKTLARLKVLNLANNPRVSAQGIAELQHCLSLKHLTLLDSNIRDRELELLGKHLQLATLDIRSTKVSEKGVLQFSDLCPGCRVEWNGGVIEPRPQMTPDRRGAEWVLSLGGHVFINTAGYDLMRKPGDKLPPDNFELLQVHLENNANVTDHGLSNLSGCRELTSLDLPGTVVSDSGMQHLDVLRNLQVLKLSGTQITDASLRPFDNCELLTSLLLDNTQVSDDGLTHFKKCTKLAWIGLSHTKITDAGLVNFSAFEDVHVLYVQGTGVTDQGLEHVARFRKLRFVYLTKTKVSEAGVTRLARALPSCHIEWDGGVFPASTGAP